VVLTVLLTLLHENPIAADRIDPIARDRIDGGLNPNRSDLIAWPITTRQTTVRLLYPVRPVSSI
jgi:hypothetical protein